MRPRQRRIKNLNQVRLWGPRGKAETESEVGVGVLETGEG